MAADVGTVKWLDEGWNGWVNGQHFRSWGIRSICEQVAAQIPGDVSWSVSNGKLTARPATDAKKLSKSDP
jgi:hypothetical protein